MRGYLGSRESLKVFGRWNDTEVRVFLDECECVPCSAAFLAAFALLSFGPAFARNSSATRYDSQLEDAHFEADALVLVGFVVAIARESLEMHYLHNTRRFGRAMVAGLYSS